MYSLLQKLSETGVTGIMLALFIMAMVFLYKRNEDLEEKLRDELKDRDQNDTYVIKSVDQTMKAILIDLEKSNHKNDC